VAGLPTVPTVLGEMELGIQWEQKVDDGGAVQAGASLGIFEGAAAEILRAERIVLNFLGHLSGVATLTHKYVQQAQGTKVRIYDTRKTTPGWRLLEKYAVRCGGGHNHRLGLYDAILIKDNHLALLASEGMTPAMAAIRAKLVGALKPSGGSGGPLLIEIEIDRLDDLDAVLRAAPDIVLLDNMSPAQLAEAVACRNRVAPQVELEASGGVSLETVRAIAQAGVDRISVGALTHSAPSMDFGLDWLPS
jgi:nicotinate-nucleotide pyrophosphorylase (carboxylating)